MRTFCYDTETTMFNIFVKGKHHRQVYSLHELSKEIDYMMKWHCASDISIMRNSIGKVSFR